VDGSAFDFNCEDKIWEFNFRFSGEKAMDFDVIESNMEGVLLGTRGRVIKRKKYAYKCSVILQDEFDFSKAQLFIDGKEFHDLHLKATEHKDPKLEKMDVETLKDKYEVELPCKINYSAPVGVVSGLRAWAVEEGGSPTAVAGFAVEKAAAANAAYLGAVSAISAAASGAAMVSEAAVEASPTLHGQRRKQQNGQVQL
jgi:hypothetical protein